MRIPSSGIPNSFRTARLFSESKAKEERTMALGTVWTLPSSTAFFPKTEREAGSEQEKQRSHLSARFLRKSLVMTPRIPGSTPADLAWAIVTGTPAFFAIGR